MIHRPPRLTGNDTRKTVRDREDVIPDIHADKRGLPSPQDPSIIELETDEAERLVLSFVPEALQQPSRGSEGHGIDPEVRFEIDVLY